MHKCIGFFCLDCFYTIISLQLLLTSIGFFGFFSLNYMSNIKLDDGEDDSLRNEHTNADDDEKEIGVRREDDSQLACFISFVYIYTYTHTHIHIHIHIHTHIYRQQK